VTCFRASDQRNSAVSLLSLTGNPRCSCELGSDALIEDRESRAAHRGWGFSERSCISGRPWPARRNTSGFRTRSGDIDFWTPMQQNRIPIWALGGAGMIPRLDWGSGWIGDSAPSPPTEVAPNPGDPYSKLNAADRALVSRRVFEIIVNGGHSWGQPNSSDWTLADTRDLQNEWSSPCKLDELRREAVNARYSVAGTNPWKVGAGY
jgi:hypothetical protein